MAIGDNSYGTVEEVEALVRKYTISGSFTTASIPTLAQVEGYIDKVSGVLNVMLAEQGFEIPVSQADAKLALDLFVVEEAAALCESANSSGRFFSDEAGGTGAFRLIQKDAETFIESHHEGIEQLGAARDRALSQGIDWWDQNDAGDDIEPIFQREGWMRQTVTDWDTG